MHASPYLYCAVDTSDFDQALKLIKQIRPWFKGIKLGLEFYTYFGHAGVRKLARFAGPETSLFLDLKFHDIPNTVAASVAALKPLRADYLTLHAAGGPAMIRAAAKVVEDSPTQLLGVTLLTSLNAQDISIFSSHNIKDTVRRLAGQAIESGCHGLVCSPHEIEILRAEFGTDVILMVPGIRPKGTDTEDQRRVMTPEQALHAGASHLVIGRPVTRAENPAKAAEDINLSLSEMRLAS